MTTLAEFQRRTVEVALERLDGPGPRRFLVADEVGLGKTVIARAIAEGLRRKRQRLNVMYLCPSLEIVGQNRLKLVSLTGIDEKEYGQGEDRLALVPGALPDEGNGYRIFTFTPETSLPGWKPGPRTGRKAERALIRTVLDRYDALRQEVLRLDRQRGANARPLFGENAPGLEGYTYTGIDRALRDVFGCPTGSLEKAIITWLEGGANLSEFVARFRSALALAALRSKAVRPDLVILDEFHRYADLIVPRQDDSTDEVKSERVRVHQLLVNALLNGDQPPAVLLLSATPYRLRKLNGEDVHPVEHYRALVDLAGFLGEGPGCRTAVEAALRGYHDALSAPGSTDTITKAVLTAKERLESLLHPLMARTERALIHEADLFERETLQVEVEAQDLMLFRHFAESSGTDFAGWAPAIWSSIPYPAQTLHGYKVWKKLAAAKNPPVEAGSGRGRFAHPQLRALSAMTGESSNLGLPWQPPTLPWWRLEGPWSSKRTLPGKMLLFSKWRGAPTAISALLSIDLSGGLRKSGTKAPPPLLRPGGSESGALIAIFTPWPNLSHAVQPTKSAGCSLQTVRRNAQYQLEEYLRSEKVSLDGKEKRPTWIVACGIERHISAQSFNRMVSAVAHARTSSRARYRKAISPIASISRSELSALAEHILSAPGSIVARCVRRHGIPQNTKREMQRVFCFTWDRLRGYLGHRTFAEIIVSASNRRRYPDALCEAMLKGGFEAVLDEQMGLFAQLGDAGGIEIIEQLSNCLLDRPGLVQFRRSKR